LRRAYFGRVLLHPRDFVSFIDGRYGGEVVTIARVPGEYTRQIDSLSSDLLCGREYAIKLMKDHSLAYEKFQLIQPAIDRGYVKRVRNEDRFELEFLYYDETDPGLPYLLVVKAVGRSELWLKTFYRTERWKEKRYFSRKGRLLKEHADLE
jgi:hypothetical protein